MDDSELDELLEPPDVDELDEPLGFDEPLELDEPLEVDELDEDELFEGELELDPLEPPEADEFDELPLDVEE